MPKPSQKTGQFDSHPKPRAMNIRIFGPYAQQLRDMWKQLHKAGLNNSACVADEVLNEIFNLTLRWEDRLREAEKEAK